MLLQPLVTVALVLLGIVGIRSLYRWFPLPEDLKQSPTSAQASRSTRQKLDLLEGTGALIFGLGGGYAGWWICRTLCAWRASGFQGEYILVPQGDLCLLGALPLAFVAGIAGAWLMMKAILGPRFEDYKRRGSLRLAFDVPSFLRFMLICCSVLAVIGIALPCNTYMVMSDHGLRCNWLFGFRERQYDYSEIDSIEKTVRVRNRFKSDIGLKMHFRDGQVWDSENAAELTNQEAEAVIEYVSARSGLFVIETKTAQR